MSISDPNPSPVDVPLPQVPPRDWKLIAQRFFALVFSLGITAFILLNREIIEDYAVYGYPSIFVISLLFKLQFV